MDREIRILIAEEDGSFLKMVEDSLEESGGIYHIDKVSSGGACLKMLRKGRYDILLLDHLLPDGKGLEWLRQFREQGVDIPTIFVSAKGDPRLAIEAMREGVFDYINRSAECAKAFPFVVNRAIEGYGLMVEKVRLQKELIETKNFLESIVEKAGDAISVVDLDGKVLYWNEGAERIYGYRKEEVLDKRLSDFLYPPDERSRAAEEKLVQQLMARVKKGEVVPNIEVKRQTKDGREIITSMTISPLRGADGKIIGASRICKDITHLKKAEEKLALAERLSSLGELTAGVAHELRNPLAGIKINTQILSRKKDLPEMEKRLLASTQEGVEKIQKAEKLAASSETTVLTEGETGTGKELLAEYIHFLSPRSSFPFVPLNCGAIPKDLFESELFGYEKGAFTGALEKGKMGKVEAAEKGTLFLDEVGELPFSSQVKVLRVLEEKEFFKVGSIEKKKADIRIIAATNKDLESEVKKGRFRDDLYFRLNVVKLRIPPLRERKEDILALFRFFVDRFNQQFQKGFVQVSEEAEERILGYPWFGNVRELRNAVERIVLLERGDTILARHLSFLTDKGSREEEQIRFKPHIPPQGVALDDVEKEYILEALRIKKGNKIQAAKLLGISRSALIYRMDKYGIK